jgi:hypothetical protein
MIDNSDEKVFNNKHAWGYNYIRILGVTNEPKRKLQASFFTNEQPTKSFNVSACQLQQAA